MATYSDNFNRADAGTLGANWLDRSNGSTFGIVSNAAAIAATADALAIYNNTFTNDQYSKVTIVGSLGASVEHGLVVRASGASWAAWSGYLLYVSSVTDFYAAGCAGKIVKYVSGTPTTVSNVTMAPVVINNIVELRAVGTTISAYVNTVSKYSGTDSSVSSGAGGMGGYIGSGTMSFDAWEGGDLGGASLVVNPLSGRGGAAAQPLVN